MNFAKLIPESLRSMTDEEFEKHDAGLAFRMIEAQRKNDEATAALKRRDLIFQGCPKKDVDLVVSQALKDTDALRASQLSIEDGKTLVALSGGYGTGKTTAATWWALRAWPRIEDFETFPVMFISASKLSRYPRYDGMAMNRIIFARALVIDDLGTEFNDKNGSFLSTLDEVVNARYANELPTLITTNLPAKDFKIRYSERIADRIREAGAFVPVKGESMRGK